MIKNFQLSFCPNAFKAEAEAHFAEKQRGNGVLDGADTFVARLCNDFADDFALCIGYQLHMIMFAAHNNIACTLPWLCLHMLNEPGCVERCRTELEKDEVQVQVLTKT